MGKTSESFSTNCFALEIHLVQKSTTNLSVPAVNPETSSGPAQDRAATVPIHLELSGQREESRAPLSVMEAKIH